MAETKRSYPTKSCPGCGKPLHARSNSHPACGWTATAGASKSKNAPAGSISIEDIKAVKELADRIGVEKLRQLAEVLG